MTVDEVLAAVDRGELSAKEALEQERAASRPRATLLAELEARMATKPKSERALVTVVVNRERVPGRAAFVHPGTKVTIGDRPAAVPDDTWTQQLLAARLIKTT